MPTLSATIVIPALNEEKFIGRCLASIQKLNYPSELIKLVVADNGSIDKTREIAGQYTTGVITVPRQSIGHTRNVGAGETDSEIIAFIDADIVVHPDWLTKAIDHFQDIEVVAVGSYPSVIMEESNRLQRTWSKLCRNTSSKPSSVDWLPSANLIVRRSAFKQINGFNEDLITCEDSDLGYRLKVLGKIINDPEVLVYHLREPATFGEFFKKEVWHSSGNIAGAFNHGMKFSEIPSLALPAIFGAGLMFAGMAPFFGIKACLLGFILLIFPPCLYTLKKLPHSQDIIYVFIIYLVYLGARSFSFYRDLSKIITAKVCNVFK